jgi:hypothetical protein
MADTSVIQQTPSLSIIAPMLVQASLMLLITLWLAWARVGSVTRGKVLMKDVAKNGWQGWIKNAGDNYSNNYEAPILFFILCFVFLILEISTHVNVIGSFTITVAWVFVVSRALHAVVHLSFNHILTRFLIFFVGIMCLIIMTFMAWEVYQNIAEYPNILRNWNFQ